jgi:hypothetical protein
MSIGPKVAAVEAEVLRGSTGNSPVAAALVPRIMPAGAERHAPAIETGPATTPSVPGAGPRLLPFTAIAAGLVVRKSNAVGGAALKVPASGLVT